MRGDGRAAGLGRERGLEFDQWPAPEGYAWACRAEWYFSDPVELPDLNQWETELAFKLR